MNEPELDRWTLFRDGLVFQVKLALDALRDFVLSLVSVACLVFDLLRGQTMEKSLFYRLMVIGHKSDSWINLFGTRSHEGQMSEENVDQLFAKLEVIIKDQHNKGGMTASAKAAIDRYLDKINSMSDTETPGKIPTTT